MRKLKPIQMPYSLDYTCLEDGDIILSDGSTEDGRVHILSRIIRLFTWSHYSHAALYLRGSVFESTGGGVFDFDVRRCRGINKKSYCVLRKCGGLSFDEKKRIEEFVRQETGKGYSIFATLVIGICKFFLPSNQATGRMFCSRFVSQAYWHAGIRLHKNYNFCSPGSFLRVPKDVLECHDDFVRKRNLVDDQIDRVPDAARANRDALNRWLDKAKLFGAICGYKISTENSAYEAAAKNKILDKLIAHYLKKSGYLENYQVILDETHRGLFSIEKIISCCIASGTPVRFVEDMKKSIYDAMRFVGNYKMMVSNCQSSNSDVLLLLCELYYKLSVIQDRRLQVLIDATREMCCDGVIDPRMICISLNEMMIMSARIGQILQGSIFAYSVFTQDERSVLGV